MTLLNQLRQRSVCYLLLIALVLTFSLVACGQQANARNTDVPMHKSMSQQQQSQPIQPAPISNNNTNSNLQSTDQQVQSIISQLEGARNDVNSSNAASSQDYGQQP